jgi:hypothetical protein
MNDRFKAVLLVCMIRESSENINAKKPVEKATLKPERAEDAENELPTRSRMPQYSKTLRPLVQWEGKAGYLRTGS